MPKLTPIRGLPGSGKSTMAREIVVATYAKHYEADAFFMDRGVYRFDPAKLPAAHKWCQSMTLDALKEGHDVVVANTFTRLWEMQPYMEMGFPIEVIVARGNWPNVHGVPVEAIERMRARWED